MPRRPLSQLKDRWGELFFWLLGVLGIAKALAFTDNRGHYRLFVAAGEWLWRGEVPYGAPIHPVGMWLYSPACGMFFFRPFGFLPEAVGLALYLVLSALACGLGLRALLTAVRTGPKEAELREAGRAELREAGRAEQVLWLALSGVFMIGLQSNKLEVAMAGAIAWAVSWLLRRPDRPWLAAAVLGTLVNFKFQPLPLSLLVGGVWVLRAIRGPRKPAAEFLAVFAAVLAFWYLVPAVFLGWGGLMAQHHAWAEHMGAFTARAFGDFENLFRFLRVGLGIPLTLEQSRWVSAALALASAAAVGREFYRAGGRGGWQSATLLAVLLGTVYTLVCSPLNQNNGFIALAPAGAAALALSGGAGGRFLRWVLAVEAIVMALAYSSLVPEWVYVHARDVALKAAVLLVCTILFTASLLRSKSDELSG